MSQALANLGSVSSAVVERLFVEVPESTGTTSLVSRIPTPAAPSVRPGATVTASWSSDCVHLFTHDAAPTLAATTGTTPS